MAAVKKGVGMVWSVGALVFTAGIASATNKGAQQSQRLSRTSEKAELRTLGGTVIGQVYHGFRKTLNVTVIPYHDTTVAGAETSIGAWALQPSTKVTITNTTDFSNAADNYNVLSSDDTRTIDGLPAVELVLEAGDEGTEIATDPIN